MARLLATLFVLTLTIPLRAQPIPAGGEVRVRGAEDTPWVLGLFARHDSTTLTMTYAGTERVYELASLERVEWHTDCDLPPRVVPQVKLVWPQPSGPDLAPAMRAV